MKRLILTMAITLIASPAFAQEGIDLGGFLLDLPAPAGARGAPARGAPPPGARGAAPNVPPVDRLVRLKDLLTQSKAPLAKEQETALNGLLDAEIPNMRKLLAARILELQKTKAAAAGVTLPAPGTPGAAPAPMAARGQAPAPPAPAKAPAAPALAPGGAPPPQRGTPGPAGPAPMPFMPSPEEVAPDISRLNDQLLAKISDAPALNPDQKTVVKKLYRDQIRARGGFDALKLTMDDANAAFTAEQTAQIQPLFEEQIKAKAELARQTPGQPPDKAKTDQLERETLAKVLKLLNPAQRTALLSAPKQ